MRYGAAEFRFPGGRAPRGRDAGPCPGGALPGRDHLRQGRDVRFPRGGGVRRRPDRRGSPRSAAAACRGRGGAGIPRRAFVPGARPGTPVSAAPRAGGRDRRRERRDRRGPVRPPDGGVGSDGRLRRVQGGDAGVRVGDRGGGPGGGEVPSGHRGEPFPAEGRQGGRVRGAEGGAGRPRPGREGRPADRPRQRFRGPGRHRRDGDRNPGRPLVPARRSLPEARGSGRPRFPLAISGGGT